ncbi:RNA polymerase sigma-70 factor (ECF subfamily) [Humibacillus xanthopallidus]|uniref:RNA polymerase sigma-70 factor (ECF subfamily) n=2 Tax=Humibacillus xanthopallidus TaxID=412689 RepID=A0A543I3D2_9MICO|nr:RNA polymerase sigma-70 factor (ECF subfamily) [Humibacillus xanthopallidus]
MDPMSRFSVVPSGDTSPEGPARIDLERLLRRSAAGDEDAFAELYDAVSSRLYGLVRRVLRDPAQSEEVAQEVFLDIWRQSARFDPARGSALSWMLTIAHRRAVDRVRSAEASRQRDDTYGTSNQDVDHDSTSEAVVERLDAERVHRALATLTEAQRQALELAYLSGYTHTEVATMLDLPLGTAKTRIRDGLIRLRDTLGVTS